MVENGKISVTCEFCSANYEFEPDAVQADASGRQTTSVFAVNFVNQTESISCARWGSMCL